MSAFAFWSAGHVIVRGDAAGILFFGGFFVLSALGMAHIDARRRASGGP
ncbi:MAG: NnrU family protein [Rhodospirillaceae bacterium]